MARMKWYDWTAFGLTTIGGISWGVIGVTSLFGSKFDLVDVVFGSIPVVRDVVYMLVGVAAVWGIVALLKAHFKRR